MSEPTSAARALVEHQRFPGWAKAEGALVDARPGGWGRSRPMRVLAVDEDGWPLGMNPDHPQGGLVECGDKTDPPELVLSDAATAGVLLGWLHDVAPQDGLVEWYEYRYGVVQWSQRVDGHTDWYAAERPGPKVEAATCPGEALARVLLARWASAP